MKRRRTSCEHSERETQNPKSSQTKETSSIQHPDTSSSTERQLLRAKKILVNKELLLSLLKENMLSTDSPDWNVVTKNYNTASETKKTKNQLKTCCLGLLKKNTENAPPAKPSQEDMAGEEKGDTPSVSSPAQTPATPEPAVSPRKTEEKEPAPKTPSQRPRLPMLKDQADTFRFERKANTAPTTPAQTLVPYDPERGKRIFLYRLKCGDCGTVFFMSTKVLGSKNDMFVVRKDSTENIKSSAQCLTSSFPADSGAVYSTLHCEKCSACVGKEYTDANGHDLSPDCRYISVESLKREEIYSCLSALAETPLKPKEGVKEDPPKKELTKIKRVCCSLFEKTEVLDKKVKKMQKEIDLLKARINKT
ncbi:MAG: uncharacterized protein A8A55_0709 [Amphiamblys sp. WSBS2006]|nr:MAG: uncharacterized protein A8A55_0709 [Amphiamblys sp. WSBS2006]